MFLRLVGGLFEVFVMVLVRVVCIVLYSCLILVLLRFLVIVYGDMCVVCRILLEYVLLILVIMVWLCSRFLICIC